MSLYKLNNNNQIFLFNNKFSEEECEYIVKSLNEMIDNNIKINTIISNIFYDKENKIVSIKQYE